MKYLNLALIVVGLIITSACKNNQSITAQDIIDKSLKASGSEAYNSAKVSFKFRDGQYTSTRACGTFKLERVLVDSLGVNTVDVVTNTKFKRTQNDSVTQVADSLVTRISDAVNSVHYFAQLPYGLNDDAVQKELAGDTKINGREYHKINVWFKQEGGGTDYQDKYMYWIDKERYTVDYLAYSYEVNGGGVRFREAFNPRIVNGIRFVDYNNYKPRDKDVPLTDLDAYFIKDKLQKVSEIKTENVEVSLLNKKC